MFMWKPLFSYSSSNTDDERSPRGLRWKSYEEFYFRTLKGTVMLLDIICDDACSCLFVGIDLYLAKIVVIEIIIDFHSNTSSFR